MTEQFKMSMFGSLTYFLGLQVTQKGECVFVCQSKYAENLVKKFGQEGSKSRRTPLGMSTRLMPDEGS